MRSAHRTAARIFRVAMARKRRAIMVQEEGADDDRGAAATPTATKRPTAKKQKAGKLAKASRADSTPGAAASGSAAPSAVADSVESLAAPAPDSAESEKARRKREKRQRQKAARAAHEAEAEILSTLSPLHSVKKATAASGTTAAADAEVRARRPPATGPGPHQQVATLIPCGWLRDHGGRPLRHPRVLPRAAVAERRRAAAARNAELHLFRTQSRVNSSHRACGYMARHIGGAMAECGRGGSARVCGEERQRGRRAARRAAGKLPARSCGSAGCAARARRASRPTPSPCRAAA